MMVYKRLPNIVWPLRGRYGKTEAISGEEVFAEETRWKGDY
jgi:hypothetical protein